MLLNLLHVIVFLVLYCSITADSEEDVDDDEEEENNQNYKVSDTLVCLVN
jgi:hypothetical protein